MRGRRRDGDRSVEPERRLGRLPTDFSEGQKIKVCEHACPRFVRASKFAGSLAQPVRTNYDFLLLGQQNVSWLGAS